MVNHYSDDVSVFPCMNWCALSPNIFIAHYVLSCNIFKGSIHIMTFLLQIG